jgi:hypothetical protein
LRRRPSSHRHCVVLLLLLACVAGGTALLLDAARREQYCSELEMQTIVEPTFYAALTSADLGDGSCMELGVASSRMYVGPYDASHRLYLAWKHGALAERALAGDPPGWTDSGFFELRTDANRTRVWLVHGVGKRERSLRAVWDLSTGQYVLVREDGSVCPRLDLPLVLQSSQYAPAPADFEPPGTEDGIVLCSVEGKSVAETVDEMAEAHTPPGLGRMPVWVWAHSFPGYPLR